MKTKRQRWTDEEREIIVLHYDKWGRSNTRELEAYFPHRSDVSIRLEIDKYHHFRHDGCFELGNKGKFFGTRPGTMSKYRDIIRRIL
jgi:hypothetical protein